jgi:predicted O-linked N-acetylglucosamine transferase (SPINDLY family)
MTTDDAFRRAGVIHESDPATAERLARDVLSAQPDHAHAHALLGLLLVRRSDRAAAEAHWRRAAELQPAVAAHHSNLAELLRQLGRPIEAEVAFRAALALAPRWPEAHFGLANALKDAGRVADALAAYAQAIELHPTFARALYNRANLLREEGRVAAAERDYRAALAADPDLTDAWVNLAAALGELHRWAEAESCYRTALDRRPGEADLAASLAGAVLAQGRTADAVRLFEACEPRSADPAVARLRREMLLPPIPESRAAIAAARERVLGVLARAREHPPQLDPARLHRSSLEPPMALAYHAEGARELAEAFAAVYAFRIRPVELLPAVDGPLRVGVVVTDGHEGVYDRCLGRLVERIAVGGRVAVTLVCSRSGANVLRHLRPTFPGAYLILPARLDEAAECVRAARFAVLHFWEVGTDATNYFLPYFHPARLQFATWGWPVTSGNLRVDGYVSAAPLEPPDADRHYTERLFRLTALPTCYERPPAPPPPAHPADRRRAFRVGAETAVYLCVQNLRKWHPDFDAVVGMLLARDPHGRVVLVADEQPAITDALLARLRQALGPDVRRVGTIPRQERTGYLRLVSCADVLLDTTYYGSGANTVADAVACGTPLVTIPGPFHRGRWAGAVLAHAGLNELVADSTDGYVETAVRTAHDEQFRRTLAARLLEFGAGWFDDPRPAAELETFWLQQASSR